MKKFLLLLLLIPAFASAQTTYWSPGVPPGSTPFSPTFRGKSTGTDSLTNLYISIGNKWFQVYTAAQSWGYFSRLFKGDIKDPLNPVTLSIGDSTATDFNNFAVFKNSNGDLVTPNINYSASTNTIIYNGITIDAITGLKTNASTHSGRDYFLKQDSATRVVYKDTSLYLPTWLHAATTIHVNGQVFRVAADGTHYTQLPGDAVNVVSSSAITGHSADAFSGWGSDTSDFRGRWQFRSDTNYFLGNPNRFKTVLMADKYPVGLTDVTRLMDFHSGLEQVNDTIGLGGWISHNTTISLNNPSDVVYNFPNSFQIIGGSSTRRMQILVDPANFLTSMQSLALNGGTGRLAVRPGIDSLTANDNNGALTRLLLYAGDKAQLNYYNVNQFDFTTTEHYLRLKIDTVELQSSWFDNDSGNQWLKGFHWTTEDAGIAVRDSSGVGAFVTFPNDNNLIDESYIPKRYADAHYAPISGGGYVPASRQITVNGVAHDLSADRSYTITTANTDTTGTGFAPKAALIPYQTKAQNIAAYQPIENQRVSTSNSVSFNNATLIGTGGAGYYDMPSQSTSPASASSHLRLYSDSVNRLSWKNSTYRRTIQVPYPSDYTIRMPYLVTGTTLEDSTHASSTYVPKTTTVAGFSLSGNITLANLTATDATLTFSGSYNGSTARTIGLNLSNQNNFTAPQQVSINNSAATTSAGLELLNTNAATVGNQMFTPYLHFSSFGWGTTAGTSQQVEWRIHGDPVQGATPSAVLNFDSQINGGGWSNRASLSFGAFTAQSYTASFGSIATGTTSDALYANNNTASTSGTPNQYSPNMHWRGEVWNTTATAANNWADFTAQVQTTSGTTPTAKWTLNGSLTTTSTPSYTALFTVDNSGNAVHTGSVTATNFIGSGSTAFQSSGTSTGSDLLAMGTGGASQSTAQLQFLGSTAARSRVLERGSSTVTLASGDIYTGHVIGEQAVATAASGTQAGIGAFAVRAPVITYNGATVTDAFNVLFQGAPANATGGSWNVYGKGGVSRFTGLQADSAFKIALAVPITITEGSGGRTGQTTLVSGTKAITISGLTTSSRALVQLVTPTGVTLTTSYQAVCTSNTLTVQANVAAGTINTADGSTLNYFIVN